jgi:hypothetical protein
MPQDFADIEIVDDAELIDPSEYLADVPSGMISGVLGMMGFAVACLVGLIAGNPGYVILLRAMLAMLVCAIIGRVLGVVGEICVREFVTLYKSDRPKPIKPKQLIELEAQRKAHEDVVQSMKKSG